MKILLFLDSPSSREKETAVFELAQQEGMTVQLVSDAKTMEQMLSTDLEDKIVLCDHNRFQELDLTQPMVNSKFIIIVSGPIADVTSTVPRNLDASIFLAEDLLGTNEIGRILLRYALLSKSSSRITFVDLVKYPTSSRNFRIQNSCEKNAICATIEDLINQNFSHHPSKLIEMYAKKAAMIADELILNAIYDANPRLKGFNRQEATPLLPEETVQVSVAMNESLIALSVKDDFGRFKKDSMLHYISGSNQGDSISDRRSGGMGLRLSIDSSSQMLVQVEENKSTEMISVINIYPTIKEFRQKLKSLLCFFN